MKLYALLAGALASKKHKDLPPDIRKGIKAIARQLHPKLVGTARYKKAFFADVDLMTTVKSKNFAGIAAKLQEIVKNLPESMYFSDFKCGGTKSRGRHWSKRQVIAGTLKGLSLEEALSQPAITKMDLVVPVKTKQGTRLVEMTNFIYMPGVSAPFGNFLLEMKKDIDKYSKASKKLKVIKRKLSALLWTDKKKDQREINKLFEYVKGKPGKLGTYLADCEVARLLVKNKQLQTQQLAYLSKIRGEKVTMRNLKRVETELSKEINELID